MTQKNIFIDILKNNADNHIKLDDNLLQMAYDEAWKLFQSGLQESLCRVNILEYQEDYLAVIVYLKDYSFIVDSSLLTFKDFPLEKKFLSIPVFAVNRENNSTLNTFEEGAGPDQESLSIYIFKKLNDFSLVDLQLKLEETLDMVVAVNKDWAASRAKITELQENQAFFEWLLDNNFIFLASFDLEKDIAKNLTGLLKTSHYKVEDFLYKETFSQDLSFRRSIILSRVHRNTNMDIIAVKQKEGFYRFFIGFFTSAVYFQPVTSIPVIREKINHAISQNNNLIKAGYLLKELIAELQSYPRSELFQMSQIELNNLVSGLISIIKFPQTKVFGREGSDDFKSFLIFIPKEKFSMSLQAGIEKIFSDKLHCTIFRRYMKISESSFMTLQFIVKASEEMESMLTTLEGNIANLLSDWEEKFQLLLINSYDYQEGRQKFLQFKELFDQDYKYKNSPQEGVEDLFRIENLRNKPSIFITNNSKIKIYSKEKLEMSSVIPMLDNLALTVVEMASYHLSQGDLSCNLYLFDITPIKIKNLTLSELEENFQNMINKPLSEDDLFNKLIVLIGLTWQEILIVRAYFAYLKQLGMPYNQSEVLQAFIKNPEAILGLCQLFREKFSTNKDTTKINNYKNNLMALLSKVEDIQADKILQDYFGLIKATKRSNIRFADESNYLTFKIATQELDFAPLPKPYREVFVYAKNFEALHMRSNKVARGGIRWSDRKFDYRTELLGLLKAQMNKNSIIVPDGAKGAFVVKELPGDQTFAQAGVTAYETFLSALLDVTDNFLAGQLVMTDKSAIWDDPDPYLVVAADKGTATFSDRANALALSRNFWLGDAFASGGSAGYDHKKLAITSKGAWISVQEHSKKLGIQPEVDQITLVGIGDMSGDVFGNGLLRSQTMQLIAAFNHLHIFLDPNPDPKISYEERLRLFNLPNSQWKDYNPELISDGGGVFDRKAKTILLSEQVKSALDLDEQLLEIKPDDLIKAILMAPVDLLWNGGIGTYVKSSTESNEMVGDKYNDSVRIDGKNLRCRMVAEGGNLGFTQLGRREYARQGGLINNDAIDNSGGVDCSDHEVNIKIALASLDNISLNERNALLERLEPAVVELVLKDNREQNEIISLDEGRGKLEEQLWLIQTLEERGELNPELAKLPCNEQIADLDYLTRPELSVLLAYAKNSATRALLQEKTLDNLFELDLFKQLYLDYFPLELHSGPYLIGLEKHKLKREILVSMLVNDMVNTMGVDYFHLRWLKTGVNPLDLIKNFFLVKYGLGLSNHKKTRDLQLLIESLSMNIIGDWDNNFYYKLQNLAKDFEHKALAFLLYTDNKEKINYHQLHQNYLLISKYLSLDLIQIFTSLASKLNYHARTAVLILLNKIESKIILIAYKILVVPELQNQLEIEIQSISHLDRLEEQDPGQSLASLILLEQNLDQLIKNFSQD